MNDYKIWIARDEGLWYYDDLKLEGKLHIFYDTPELLYNQETNSKYWGNARVISEISSYMYPNIKEMECIVYDNYEYYNK